MDNLKNKIRIGCVGAGYFARYHLDAWQRLSQVEVVAVCDLDMAKARSLADEFSIENVFDDFEKMTTECDFSVVDIITPTNTHLDLISFFLESKKHIICQKPLAPDLLEARKIEQVVSASTQRFMVHENFRWQPWHRKIKQLLDEQILGERIHTITLRLRTGDGWGEDAYLDRQPYFRTMPRLFMFETGVHYIDVFRFLFGEVESVYASLRRLNPVIKGEDCALVIFTHTCGTQSILDVNRYNEGANGEDPRYTFGAVQIEGEKGTLSLDTSGKIMLKKLGQPPQEIIYQRERKGFAGDCVYFTQKHFIENLISGDPFETEIEDYLVTLEVLEEVYERGKR